MRRFCITLVLVPSLLVAAAPANAKSTAGHRQEARAGGQQVQVKTQRVNRTRNATLTHKYTYGRT